MSELHENLESLRRKVYARAEHRLIMRQRAGARIDSAAFDKPAFNLSGAVEPLAILPSDLQPKRWLDESSELPATTSFTAPSEVFDVRNDSQDLVVGATQGVVLEPNSDGISAMPDAAPRKQQTTSPSRSSSSTAIDEPSLTTRSIPSAPQRGVIKKILAALGWSRAE